MAKKKNSRKALAVALGIMGVAGLSVASASQLTIDAADNVAAGSTAIDAACDTAVKVDYTIDFATLSYTALNVDDIAVGCDGLTLQYALKDDADAVLKSGTVTLDNSGTAVLVWSPALDIETTEFGSIDIAIY